MRACGQIVGLHDTEQVALYEDLLREELAERQEAIVTGDTVDEFDADLDILAVHLGRMLSRWPESMVLAGWAEVWRSNMSKAEDCHCGGMEKHCACGGTSYRVRRREDGKILKPDSYSPPDLASLMRNYGYEV